MIHLLYLQNTVIYAISTDFVRKGKKNLPICIIHNMYVMKTIFTIYLFLYIVNAILTQVREIAQEPIMLKMQDEKEPSNELQNAGGKS